MKLGTRIPLVTTALVLLALGLFGLVTVRVRNAELEGNVERETQSIGKAVRVALEAALQEGLFEDVRRLVARIRAAEAPLGITYLELAEGNQRAAEAPATGDGGAAPLDGRAASVDAGAGRAGAREGGAALLDGGAAAIVDGGALDSGARQNSTAAVNTATGDGDDGEDARYQPPPPDPTRDERVRRILIEPLPWGEHIVSGGRPVYAYAVPLRDDDGRVVAVIDLVRDESDVAAALAETERNTALAVVVAGLVLGLLVWVTTRGSLSRPIERLVEGIDEVAVGDLTRALLGERDDEIGQLADRFNQMTSNLREARAETQRGLEARLDLESRLRQSEKLATIGELAANIAHEVGTPLNVIGGRARAMEKKAGEPEAVAKNAGIIAAQADRITKIIQQLLDYARKKPGERAAVDVQRVVSATIDFLEHRLTQARVVVDRRAFSSETGGEAEALSPPLPTETTPQPPPTLPPTQPVVLGDADQLQQVCLNLCVNAIQAMPEGGRLTVSTRGVVQKRPGLAAAPPGRYVMLEVGDTGPGIPDAVRERIFEPFYSTKHDAGGTGLGLAVSLGIVKDHDGWIDVESSAAGTQFRVFLPAQ